MESRAKYLLFPLPIACLATFAVLLVEQWFRAVASIQNKFAKTKAGDNALPGHFKVIYLAFCWGGTILVNTIVPMIVFDDKTKLNWAYSFSITFNGILGFVVVSLLIISTWQLLQACVPEAGLEATGDLAAVLKKVGCHHLFLLFISCL